MTDIANSIRLAAPNAPPHRLVSVSVTDPTPDDNTAIICPGTALKRDLSNL